jgi:hypothetical protein
LDDPVGFGLAQSEFFRSGFQRGLAVEAAGFQLE